MVLSLLGSNINSEIGKQLLSNKHFIFPVKSKSHGAAGKKNRGEKFVHQLVEVILLTSLPDGLEV